MADKKTKSHRELIDTGRDKRFVRRDDVVSSTTFQMWGVRSPKIESRQQRRKYRRVRVTVEIRRKGSALRIDHSEAASLSRSSSLLFLRL